MNAKLRNWPEYYEENPHEVSMNDLNNFYCYLSGGMNREIMEKTGRLELVLGEIDSSDNNSNVQYHSKKRLNQTYADFFKEIDSSIYETGNTPSEIENYTKEIKEITEKVNKMNIAQNFKESLDQFKILQEKRKKITQNLFEKAHPIYLNLREKGYTHYDLCV
jgi:hypothetical protein